MNPNQPKLTIIDYIIRIMAIELLDPNLSHPEAQQIMLFLFELRDREMTA